MYFKHDCNNIFVDIFLDTILERLSKECHTGLSFPFHSQVSNEQDIARQVQYNCPRVVESVQKKKSLFCI